MPLYASPEQLMRERSELARKGIARGRSVVVLKYRGGVLFVAENPSPTLHKVSEIYDRIGFAAVGRYSEFESLRRGGIRHVDLQGYMYDRRDVNARALANVYAGLQAGVTTIDSAAGGLGGCPFAPGAAGNLATGDLIYMLDGLGIETGVDLAKVVAASRLIGRAVDHALPSRYLSAAQSAIG